MERETKISDEDLEALRIGLYLRGVHAAAEIDDLRRCLAEAEEKGPKTNPVIIRAKLVPGFGLVQQWANGQVDLLNTDGQWQTVHGGFDVGCDGDPNGLVAKAMFGDAIEAEEVQDAD